MKTKCELYNDNFQNFKRYGIPKAQLVIADIPYNVGNNFYGSNPMWYKGGNNANGESNLAGKAAFNTDYNFNIAEYFHFCNKLLKSEPKKSNGRGKSSDAPCMIVFCSFEQIQTVIKYAQKYGFKHYIPLVFCKNYSPQVLKANMRVCGAVEYALVLYRDKLPKFRNDGHMVFNPAAVNSMMPEGTTYEEYMQVSFTLLDMCDAICLMDGWRDSKGANREYGYALAKDMIIVEE